MPDKRIFAIQEIIATHGWVYDSDPEFVEDEFRRLTGLAMEEWQIYELAATFHLRR